MSKAADIYWDSPRRTATKRPAARARRVTAAADRRTAPRWLSFLIVIAIFVMICVSINFRAFSDVRAEADQNVRLSSQIENLMDENLALQEEIHSLKTDPQVIQREAKRIGISIQQEKVPVPAN
ncbi:MAG: septum formation initiator family protein [Pyrinomonadaceae bacterium]